MIDTDKYEGHLIDKAIEDNSQVWCWSKWMLKNAETIEQHKATYHILVDAPLLLAEVLRLRESIKQLTVKVEGMSTGYRHLIVKTLREMIK